MSGGLYFRREDAGAVSVRLAEDARPGAETVFSCNITETGWASVVAAVSLGGETSDSYQAALDLHAGRLPERIT